METEIKNDTEARAKELYRFLKSCQADIQQMVLDNVNRRWEANVAGIRGRKPAARIIGKCLVCKGRGSRRSDIYAV